MIKIKLAFVLCAAFWADKVCETICEANTE